MQEAEVDIRPFAVCSDVRVGRKATDEGEISTIDLTEPATTDADTLVARMAAGRRATPRMTVVFSTYQSIDVIAEAQRQGLGDFDLVDLRRGAPHHRGHPGRGRRVALRQGPRQRRTSAPASGCT